MAHDFNNILTAITGYADLGLLKMPAESPLRRNFEEILAASERAALLTQQLLAFSRRQVITPRVIDINAVFAELGKTLRRLLGADIDLSIRPTQGLARIMADPALIEQLIINLVVSARDAMPHGGAIAIDDRRARSSTRPTRSTIPRSPPGPYVCLTISAHGPEWPRSTCDALCGPAGAPQEPQTGIALGPAAVSDIIQQGGGHAPLGTSPDAGTTVRIYFPAVSADAAGAPRPDSASSPAARQRDDPARGG